MDFSISDPMPDQAHLLDAVAKAYGLNPSDSQPTIDANLAQAMIVVAARMTQEERENVGFTLHDLVSECIVDGEPCDMENDFQRVFDVDYGHQPEAKYVTKRTGTASGLKMIVVSSSSEYLMTSSLQGVKLIVHPQETHPFPNGQGYMASVGQQKGFVVTKGCLRSCFQHNVIATCGCADPRFPFPEEDDIEYCTPLDSERISLDQRFPQSCYEDYIAAYRDYYSVENCRCYDPCEAAAFTARMPEANWPAGGFFYGGFCPKASSLNFSNCAEFYRENSATIEVSFGQLGYQLMKDSPSLTASDVIKSMAGNTGLRIGFTAVSVGELVLIVAQLLLWICTKTKELPEVPSCRHRNYTFTGRDDSEEDDDDDDEPANRDKQKLSTALCVPVAQSGALGTDALSFAPSNQGAEMVARHRLPPKSSTTLRASEFA